MTESNNDNTRHATLYAATQDAKRLRTIPAKLDADERVLLDLCGL
jgi:hypothetical protein